MKMAPNEMVKFTNAGLPAQDLGKFVKKAQESLQKARDHIQVGQRGLFLRLTKNQGEWVYGQENTQVEEGALWAVNPFSLQIGAIAWPPNESTAKQPIKKMKYIFDDNAPDIIADQLPDPAHGGVWDPCVAFQCQCIGGTDKKYKYEDIGKVLSYQQNSDGGKRGFDDLLASIMQQIGDNPKLCVPVIELLTDSYQHPKWGTQYKPIFRVDHWVAMTGENTKVVPEEGDEEDDQGAEQQEEAQDEPQQEAETQTAQTTRRRGPATAETQATRGRRGPAAAAAQPAQQVDRGVVRRRRRG